MQVQPVKFTASGLIGAAGFTATIDSPEPFNSPFQPAYMSSDQVVTPAQSQRIVGFAFKGFSAVTVYNGVDNTGDPVAVASSAGTYSWNYEVNCNKGLYIEVTGTGSGTVWLA